MPVETWVDIQFDFTADETHGFHSLNLNCILKYLQSNVTLQTILIN